MELENRRLQANAEEAPAEEEPALLVVDDDPDILRIVQFFLSKQKYQVHTANDGEEALKVLEQHPEIELILSDVMMPRISGLDLLTAIRKHPTMCETPVILISAEGETSQKVKGLNLGADDFITKPFNFDELMARVRNHLRLRRLQRDLLHANDLLKRQNEILVADLETAKGVQRALMPDGFPANPDYRLGACYLPVERLGGDFFDVVQLDDEGRLGVLIADVCGHGVAAAFITAMTKITFRNACFATLDPARVLFQMNAELTENLSSGYVTAFYGVFDFAAHTFTYASGGHPPVLVHRADGDEIIRLAPQETFLGIFDPVDFKADTFRFRKGDRVVFYTDGLFESCNGEGEPFGMERVTGLITGCGEAEMQPLLDKLLAEVRRHAADAALEDDVTLVGLDILR